METFAVVISIGHRISVRPVATAMRCEWRSHIGDDAAANGSARFMAPQFMPVIGVERKKIAAHVAEKHDAAGGRRHAGLDRNWSSPATVTGRAVGVNRIDPAGPVVDDPACPNGEIFATYATYAASRAAHR
jgi:hypothetical protein